MSELPADGTLLVIEGGGSHTSAALVREGIRIAEAHGSTSNPRSTERHAAQTLMREALAPLLRRIGPTTRVCVAHGAASTPAEAQLLASEIRRIVGAGRVRGLMVTNDLVPLAMSAPDHDVVVAAAGTGTGFLGRTRDGRWHRASGYEFVLSDEGGGYDIGLRVLRAVVRELDGRGPRTALTPLLLASLQVTRDALPERLFDLVYGRPAELKAAVAPYAELAFVAHADGDDVASRLLSGAADEIVLGITGVLRRLDLGPGAWTLILTGSLLTAQDSLRALILDAMRADRRPADCHLTTDLLGEVSRCEDHAERLDAEASVHRWLPFFRAEYERLRR